MATTLFGEDPTVNRLQEIAAEKMGKETALLFPAEHRQISDHSCVTANEASSYFSSQSPIFTGTKPEGYRQLQGCFLWALLKSETGALDPDELEAAIRPKNVHFPEPTLICIENTHNRHGGTIITPKQLRAIREVAEKHSMKLYMDGARIFNAAIGLGVDVKEFTKHVDNLMFSLSKGLCCPVGSIIVGKRDFIEKAKKTRKLLGGGMRQAGIIAAPELLRWKE